MPRESTLLYSLDDYERITGRKFLEAYGNLPASTSEASQSHFDARTKALIWDKTGGLCFYCGLALNPYRNFSIDHVVPKSRGGSDDPDNLVPACRRCNCRKGASYG